MLPVWAVLGHNVLYIGVGILWLSYADDGVTDEELVTRETNHTYGYQLAALFCFAVLADNVLSRIEGAGQTAGFWLTSGKWELIVVFSRKTEVRREIARKGLRQQGNGIRRSGQTSPARDQRLVVG